MLHSRSRPSSAANGGVFSDALSISDNKYHIFSGSEKKAAVSGELIRKSGALYTENFKNLTNMIILYYLSDNKNISKSREDEFFNVERYKNLKNKTKLKSKLKTLPIIKKIELSPPSQTSEWRQSDEETSFALTHAFEVRGHWRYQACGLNHSKRKLIWINPHKRGVGEVVKKIEIVH